MCKHLLRLVFISSILLIAHNGALGATLPTTQTWQANLRTWMGTLQESDFETNVGSLSWDQTYADKDELAQFWLWVMPNVAQYWRSSATKICRAASSHFLLSAIEEPGTNIHFFRYGNQAAAIYGHNLPLSGGGQGNPYYQDRGCALRGLVSIAAELIMDYEYAKSRPDFRGGVLLPALWAYDVLNAELTSTEQRYFMDAFEAMADEMGRNPLDLQGNIQTRAIGALAYIYKLSEDPTVKQNMIDYAKLSLFGSITGTATTSDKTVGIYAPAGYITEADGPDTSYTEVALERMIEAWMINYGDSNWDFLGDTVQQQLKFAIYQDFMDPDGWRIGPSGYGNRTGDDRLPPAEAYNYRAAGAYGYAEGRPRLYGNKDINNKVYFLSDHNMLYDVTIYGVQYPNNTGSIGTSYVGEPADWVHNHWQPKNNVFPPDGWWSYIKGQIETNPGDFVAPFRPEHAHFSVSFDDEFWAYKNDDGIQDFGWFVEGMENSGGYTGWYGGSLQTFWTENAGVLILSRHNKSGGACEDDRTRCWDNIDTWAANHIYGVDDQDMRFSTAANEGKQHNVTYTPSSVVVENPSMQHHNDAWESCHLDGSGACVVTEITGNLDITNSFTALSNGIKVEHQIVYTANGAADTIKELWAVIPVFLRDSDNTAISDTTIEYWSGSAWVALTTTPVRTRQVRLGRNFGSGTKYGYVVLDAPRDVRLSDSVWVQSYQGNSRHRNIKIDLHGNPGTIIPFPTSTYVAISITTDPGTMASLAAPSGLKVAD